MTNEQILQLAAEAGLAAIVGGKRDAFYAPPESILRFAKMLMNETSKEIANVAG